MAKTIDIKIESVQTLEIDLNKKSILIIEYSELPGYQVLQDIKDMLQEWMGRNDDPLFVLGCDNGIQIRLVKMDNE